MPTWPASLPQTPRLDDFDEEFGGQVVRAPVDGPPKARRRYTAAVDDLRVSLLMTDEQMATFKTFHANEIASGALAFDWTFEGATHDYQIVGRLRRSKIRRDLHLLRFQMIRLP